MLFATNNKDENFSEFYRVNTDAINQIYQIPQGIEVDSPKHSTHKKRRV